MITDSLEFKVILAHLDNSSANAGHLTPHWNNGVRDQNKQTNKKVTWAQGAPWILK